MLKKVHRKPDTYVRRASSENNFEVDDYREVSAPDAATPIPYSDNPETAYASKLKFSGGQKAYSCPQTRLV